MKTINVHNVLEFVNAIESNKTMLLSNNIYNVTNLLLDENERIRYEKVFEGDELAFEGIENLSLIGEINTCVEILAEPRYANVITFRNCQNITLENLTLGHTKGKGECRGGVLRFENSKDIIINNCIAFGCGIEGISLHNCKNVKVTNSIIKECSSGIMTIRNSNAIDFNTCFFFNNSFFNFIELYNSFDVKLSQCSIFNNSTDYTDGSLFVIDDKSDIIVKNCKIHDNSADYFTNSTAHLTLVDTETANSNIYYKGYCKDENNNPNEYNNVPLTVFNRECRLFEIGNDKTIIYDSREKIILKENKVDLLINDELPSSPELSPNGLNIAFISPFEWEVIGDLHIYDVIDKTDNIILQAEDIKEQHSIKKVVWLDDENLLLIIGFAYGTVSIGGDIYILNIKSKKLILFIECKPKEQAIDLTIKDDLVSYNLIIYDNDFNHYRNSKVTTNLNEVRETALSIE